MRWAIALVAGLWTASIPGVGWADPPAASGAPVGVSPAAVAEDLFQQGLALAQQGKWAEAAAKLEESNRVDPAPGTVVNLADVYEHMGRFASAWALFVEGATKFGQRKPPDPRADVAKARAEALLPKLSRLTIEVPESVRATKGLVVRRDGQEVGAAQWGSGIAMDPGDHVVEVSAPGKVTWKATVKVAGDAAKASVTVPALKDDASDAGAGGDGEGWPWQKKVALGVGGVGVAGLLVGGIFGGLALGKKSEMDAECSAGSPPQCNDAGLAAYEDVKTAGAVSTGMLIGGGVLAAAGVVLWVTAPGAPSAAAKDAKSSRLRVSIAPSGVSLRGTW